MFLKWSVGYCRLYLRGFGEKSSVFSPCFKADFSLVPFMCRSSCPWYCVVQLPGCGMVPGNTRERDLPSPRCQHHRGFAYGSFKQQWLEAVPGAAACTWSCLKVPAGHQKHSWLWGRWALPSARGCCCPGTSASSGWWHVGPGSLTGI